MARLTNEDVIKVKDIVLNQFLQGVTSPTEMMKVAGIDYKTATKYIAEAKTRIDELINETDRKEILKKEIISLNRLEFIAWQNLDNAQNVNHLAGIINTIIKIKEKKFDLLDLKNIIQSVIKDEQQHSSKKPLDFESHDWLVTRMQAERIIKLNQEYEQGERNRSGDRIKKADDV